MTLDSMMGVPDYLEDRSWVNELWVLAAFYSCDLDHCAISIPFQLGSEWNLWRLSPRSWTTIGIKLDQFPSLRNVATDSLDGIMAHGRGPTILIAMWTTTSIAALFVVARLYTRIKILRSVGLDDYLMASSMVILRILMIPFSIDD
jgi:hypothetical protein